MPLTVASAPTLLDLPPAPVSGGSGAGGADFAPLIAGLLGPVDGKALPAPGQPTPPSPISPDDAAVLLAPETGKPIILVVGPTLPDAPASITPPAGASRPLIYVAGPLPTADVPGGETAVQPDTPPRAAPVPQQTVSAGTTTLSRTQVSSSAVVTDPDIATPSPPAVRDGAAQVLAKVAGPHTRPALSPDDAPDDPEPDRHGAAKSQQGGDCSGPLDPTIASPSAQAAPVPPVIVNPDRPNPTRHPKPDDAAPDMGQGRLEPASRLLPSTSAATSVAQSASPNLTTARAPLADQGLGRAAAGPADAGIRPAAQERPVAPFGAENAPAPASPVARDRLVTSPIAQPPERPLAGQIEPQARAIASPPPCTNVVASADGQPNAAVPSVTIPPSALPTTVVPALQAFSAAIRRALADERKSARADAAPLTASTLAPAQAAAPVAPPGATLDTADRRWPHAMAQQIERLRDAANEGSTRIRLLPDALGPVDVAVRREGEAVHVHFTAAQAETRQLLADAQPQLAQAADARGVKLGRTEISGGDPNPGDRQQRPQAQAPQPTRPAPARTPAAGADDTDTRIA